MGSDFDISLEYAKELDEKDPLKHYREAFNFPTSKNGNCVYLNGNSLGLQPKAVRPAMIKELDDWAELAEEGHFMGNTPWLSFHELLAESTSKLVGAKTTEVINMNSLTVNLHLMMVSFYRPTDNRYKIMIEYSAFPSDLYAVQSQLKFHGYDPKNALIELKPQKGSELVSMNEIRKILEEEGDQIALIMIGGVNYYSGQVYDMRLITKLGHEHGCIVGFDLAHAVGNIPLKLHDWNVDFAVWCSYKYLNSGPGSIGGCFVHEKWVDDKNLPRFSGWWGHDKATRFLMDNTFMPIESAEGWQLSNPPIFALVPALISYKIFEEVGMKRLRERSVKLTSYLFKLIKQKLIDQVRIITPEDPKQRGSQLSIVVTGRGKEVQTELLRRGVYCDWREPDVVRIALAPMYNNYSDAWNFVEILHSILMNP